ncbi:amino acid-binding protein [Aeromicrobium senzhongii]|uniref:Amino acid-binding protein n=1 Tax=Aeromicrobium senzhongii TaxID=2663859 RepID=A0ABX6SZA1_9ACTN|nr:ACT domain-containing protein [Aeromicrobium senzhongii]MTB88493.1 amino acid-binding protein [Aeromicrobium senzhongii]QNL94545.1 amino acid-binding protein [Aeromicrobium senzhongii]
MAFLLRVELPDVPGSLGALATALGSAGADIEAIEIVEHRPDGVAVDDVLLELPHTVMPDALITACQGLEGVHVHWISRYNAGANLSMDLEAVEAFTNEPDLSIARLIEVIPSTFRTDWALAIGPGPDGAQLLHGSSAAPKIVPECDEWLSVEHASPLPEVSAWDSTVLAGSPAVTRAGTRFFVAVGRHGGPEFLASEIARIGHMVSLAASVQTDDD